MQEFNYIIKDKDGVHARPAGAIIKAIAPFKSNIYLEANGKKIALKGGIFALMGLGIKQGTEVYITIDGSDEAEAYTVIKKAFEDNL